MKSLKKMVLLAGCLLFMFTGCAKTQDDASSNNTSESVQANNSNAVSESSNEIQDTPSMVLSSDLVDFIDNKAAAIVIAGDLDSENCTFRSHDSDCLYHN